jgi:ribosomal protein S18 acetylase RimI-like enzyme
VSEVLISGYDIRRGSTHDRALLVKFMDRTYRELFPDGDFSHLARTVDQYFSGQTPLWWGSANRGDNQSAIACLWMGTAIDQVTGDRTAHIFLLYVRPEHRRRGIGAALIRQAETWARNRGDRAIGLQVFAQNEPALNLYRKLGYRTQSLSLTKSLSGEWGQAH